MSSKPERFWANLSLAAGALWLALSLAPFFITTLLGLPFAAVALGAGWWSLRRPEPHGRRRVAWGVGLGCAGCLWQIIYYSLVGGALLVGLPTLLQYLQGTPTP